MDAVRRLSAKRELKILWLSLWYYFSFMPDSDLSNHLPDAKNAFNLKIVSREPTYFKSQYGNLIETLLRNRPRRVSNSRNFEIGVSDCHK